MLRLYKIGFYLIHVLRLYVLWSKIWNLLRYKQPRYPVKRSATPLIASIQCAPLEWRPDSYRAGWDTIGHPGWVEYCIQAVQSGLKQPPGSLDCDDFASWCTHSLNLIFSPRFLVVAWLTDGKIRGHAVCLSVSPQGNKYSILDNGKLYEGFSSIGEVAKNLLPVHGQLIGYATYDQNIRKVVNVSTKFQ